MEPVNGRKLFNLSVSCAAGSLYQREPCHSLGLKCWFAIKQVYQKEPILRFIWLAILHRFIGFHSTLPVLVKRSHHPPLHREGRFAVCLSCWFIAENRIKQFAYSISQSATADSSLYQREPCCSFGLKCWFITEQVQEREPILRFIWLAI